jgi:hypothetical protein
MPFNIGGVEGDRTPDLMNAIHALSQLSYDPNWLFRRDGRTLNLSKSTGSVKRLPALEFRLSFLEKRRNAFFLVLGRKADRK